MLHYEALGVEIMIYLGEIHKTVKRKIIIEAADMDDATRRATLTEEYITVEENNDSEIILDKIVLIDEDTE